MTTEFATGKAYLSEVITLFKVEDDIQSLREDFEKLVKAHPKRNIFRLLEDIKLDRKRFIPKDVKAFYQKHQKSFDTITSSTTITNFLSNFYEPNGSRRIYSTLANFDTYFRNHQDEKENIEALLAKMKSLNIKYIGINPDIDFTSLTYYADKSEEWNETLTYLENVKVLPNYNPRTIKYHSTGSDYAITLGFCGLFGNAAQMGKDIVVNNLNFDPSHLPDKLHPGTFFHELKELDEKTREQSEKLRSSIDLESQEIDLKSLLQRTKETIAGISQEDLNPELERALKIIEDGLEAFGLGRKKRDEGITRDGTISPENLEDERQKVLRTNGKKVQNGKNRT